MPYIVMCNVRGRLIISKQTQHLQNLALLYFSNKVQRAFSQLWTTVTGQNDLCTCMVLVITFTEFNGSIKGTRTNLNKQKSCIQIYKENVTRATHCGHITLVKSLKCTIGQTFVFCWSLQRQKNIHYYISDTKTIVSKCKHFSTSEFLFAWLTNGYCKKS